MVALTKPKPRHYTARQVANRLRVTPTNITTLSNRWEIGRKVGRDWSYTDKDLEKLRQHVGHRGRRPLR